MAIKCRNKDCDECQIEKCVLDMTDEEYAEFLKAKESEYAKEYYEKNKAQIKAYRHDWYMQKKYGKEMTPQVKFVKYIEVRKAVIKLKKQIGEVNCKIILDAIDQIEKDVR